MSGTLRLVAGGLLALLCCYVGVLIKRRYRHKEEFYKSACDFATYLSSEIGFKKTPIPEIAEKFSKGKSGAFESFLKDVVDRLKRGEKVTCDNTELARFKTEEKEEMLDFLGSLGKTELKDQLALAARFAARMQERHKKCEEDSKRLGGMYFKLCVLLGLAIILILA